MSKCYTFDRENLINVLTNYMTWVTRKIHKHLEEGGTHQSFQMKYSKSALAQEYVDKKLELFTMSMEDILDQLDEISNHYTGKNDIDLAKEIKRSRN